LAGDNGGSFPQNVNFTEAGPLAGTVAAVPEPNIGILLGLGLIGGVLVRRYQNRNAAS